MKNRKMGLAVLGLTLVVGLLGVSVVQAHTSPPPGGTGNHVDLDTLPLTVAAAETADWDVADRCLPGMGRHASKDGEEITLMYNADGNLIGFEFVTRAYSYPNKASKEGYLKARYGIDLDEPSTWPVPVGPWGGPSDRGLNNAIRWSLHIYFDGADAATACS